MGLYCYCSGYHVAFINSCVIIVKNRITIKQKKNSTGGLSKWKSGNCHFLDHISLTIKPSNFNITYTKSFIYLLNVKKKAKFYACDQIFYIYNSMYTFSLFSSTATVLLIIISNIQGLSLYLFYSLN